jgi:hypothetical protein
MNSATGGEKTSNPWVETDIAVHPSRYVVNERINNARGL